MGTESMRVKCPAGHICQELNTNPKAYNGLAQCDICYKLDLAKHCTCFYHCAICKYDACTKCGHEAQWKRCTGFVAPLLKKTPESCFVGNSALLILQSAGTAGHEDVITEEGDEAGAYLQGPAMNVALVQNVAVGNGWVRQENVASYNFSGCTDADPREVVKKFLRQHREKNMCIYYTGHGDKRGAWHFTLYDRGGLEVTISPADMHKW